MTTKTLLISGGWLASAAAAFFIGKAGNDDLSESAAGSTIQSQSSTVTEIRTNERDSSISSSATDRTSQARSGPEFARRIERLANIDDPISRTRAFLELVENLGPNEFQEAVAAFRALEMTGERMAEYEILLTGWAKTDPLAALAYAKENTNTRFAQQTILGTWARDFPNDAIQWATENFEGDEGDANPWIAGIISGIASSNQELASKLLQDLPRSRERGGALDTVLSSQLSSGGPETAKAWVQSINEDHLQAGAAARLAEKMAQDDPEGTLRWAETLGEDALKRSVPDVIDHWMKEDKNSATAWINNQKDDIRAAAANGFVQNLSLDEADEWLNRNATSASYDRAIQGLAIRAIRGDSPEFGADWIMKITNERQRNRTFHRALRPWQRKDRDGLISYAQNNPVPRSILRRLNLDQN